MITKMKKLALLVYHKEYAAFLESLREVECAMRRLCAFGGCGGECSANYRRALNRWRGMGE